MSKYYEELVTALRLNAEFRQADCALANAATAADAIEELVKKVQAAEVAEVRHGRWIEWDDGEGDTFECSVCGETWVLNAGTPKENNMHYCPGCGAKMDERSEDNG